ncbi:histone-binding protein RBBP4 or subunit C of CAF1 complex-domain-containing protein [Dunaliella salina]|uniref:Histone-binding protein RBBP4 or subunit C of CAF1 complex-domain-containing protein n=1 Tax=Dunaliella salina TaxID=3046 RepID=A0ABQ7FV63_DUNSA|nr:histone-binding protein RBBP4 or subunit C of CAF1 complex-domain-containing protein [Dunaliella salina]|eukprot:KAF5826265.1 histone-binding protein RBBP4 or subunit C of CAF1 complex-domain-containing protein [Dunaliella salina]
MRNPKKSGKPGKPAGAKPRAASKKPKPMETDAPSNSAVWRPGIDPMGEDEELDYDPTAYDCLHKLQLDWPCLSFDYLKDELGAPRSTFPHTCYMAAGTQATSAKQNYVAFLRLANLGQGRHGKKAKKEQEEESDDESMSESSEDSEEEEEWDEHGPPRLHVRCEECM